MEAVIHQLTAQQHALQQREYQTRPMRTGNEKELLTAADHRELLDVWQVKQLLSDELLVKQLVSSSFASCSILFVVVLSNSSLSRSDLSVA